MKIFTPNKGLVELCLTYRCNVKCDSCSNLCTQAPAFGDLTPLDVLYFLNDLDSNSHKIGQITLHGGEPVLNPHIDAIIKLLVEYRKLTGCKLWLLTNNSSDLVRRKTTAILTEYGIPLGLSTKRGKNIDGSGSPISYAQVNNSPIDQGIEHDLGCFQTETCGICFNNLGWFPCSPLAAAARVFGFVGCKSITELTDEKCKQYFEQHCGHCGFSAPQMPRIPNQVTSRTWENALAAYNTPKREDRV